MDLDAFRGKCLQDSWNLRKFGGVDYCTNRYGQLEALSIVSDRFASERTTQRFDRAARMIPTVKPPASAAAIASSGRVMPQTFE